MFSHACASSTWSSRRMWYVCVVFSFFFFFFILFSFLFYFFTSLSAPLSAAQQHRASSALTRCSPPGFSTVGAAPSPRPCHHRHVQHYHDHDRYHDHYHDRPDDLPQGDDRVAAQCARPGDGDSPGHQTHLQRKQYAPIASHRRVFPLRTALTASNPNSPASRAEAENAGRKGR